jgi:hypothetical protein
MRTTGTAPFENVTVQNVFDADGSVFETDTYDADGVLTKKSTNEFLEKRTGSNTYRAAFHPVLQKDVQTDGTLLVVVCGEIVQSPAVKRCAGALVLSLLAHLLSEDARLKPAVKFRARGSNAGVI